MLGIENRVDRKAPTPVSRSRKVAAGLAAATLLVGCGSSDKSPSSAPSNNPVVVAQQWGLIKSDPAARSAEFGMVNLYSNGKAAIAPEGSPRATLNCFSKTASFVIRTFSTGLKGILLRDTASVQLNQQDQKFFCAGKFPPQPDIEEWIYAEYAINPSASDAAQTTARPVTSTTLG